MRIAATAALFVLSLSAATGSALATGQDNAASCISAGRQVSRALNENPQNADAARKEGRMALEYCNAGLYRQGMVHYARAMELLGVKGG